MPSGGWLLWNESEGRLDSHCPTHASCRMNKMLRKGPVGLALAWLADDSIHVPNDKTSHDIAKEILSSQEHLEVRKASRRRFESYAEDGNPHADRFRGVLRQEQDIRNALDEPVFLQCPPCAATRAIRGVH